MPVLVFFGCTLCFTFYGGTSAILRDSLLLVLLIVLTGKNTVAPFFRTRCSCFGS